MKKTPPKRRANKFKKLAGIIQNGGCLFPDSGSISVSQEEAIAFRWEEVKWEKDFYRGEKRKIPCLKVVIPPDVKITIYGSHLESPADYKLTHLFHKSRDVEIFVNEPPTSNDFPRWFVHLDQILGCWYVCAGDGVHLKGPPSQGIFQGVMNDPDLMQLISTIHGIKALKSDTHRINDFLGRRLLKILFPAIKQHDLAKIDLLKKVMLFCIQPRDVPKSLIYNEIILEAAFRAGRVPTSRLLQELLTELDCFIDDPFLCRDLKEVGLGWILKQYKR